MIHIKILSVVFLLYLKKFYAEDLNDYEQKRAKLLATASQQSIGSKVILTDRELLANDLLLKRKNMETDNKLFQNPFYINFSGSYFTYRDGMRKSKVYQLIRRMPKGAALHIHGTLLLDPDDLLKHTYEDYLYACLTEDDLKFRFSDTSPKQHCPVPWVLLKKLRMNQTNVTSFDVMLKERLTLGPEDRVGPTANTNEAWNEFGRTMSTIFSLIGYRPVRERMFYQALQNLYDDNIMYAELRIGLYYLYELDGSEHDKLYMATLFNDVVKTFMMVHPDFVGIKLILTKSRNANVESVEEELNLARKVKQILPEVFAGFDLVGQEELGKPLKKFVPVLLKAKNEIDYFFHAGETNWCGTPVDENLFDAILLGTKRIGHGNALIKHPTLIKAVHDNDIAVEVNVISNSILSLVKDLRNHPLAAYMAQGLPVVLSSDDPGLWGAKPLSDDFYVAFVTIANKHADLKMLKQLAINSIRYSALDDQGKTKLFKIFEKKWVEFINMVIYI